MMLPAKKEIADIFCFRQIDLLIGITPPMQAAEQTNIAHTQLYKTALPIDMLTDSISIKTIAPINIHSSPLLPSLYGPPILTISCPYFV